MKIINLIALAATALLFSSGAYSQSVVGSKHDLSSINTSTTEVCVFCHTPHQAVVGQQPLWNRAITAATFTVYSSDTMDAIPGQPLGTSKLCLGCHDGTLAVDAVSNPPNTGTFVQGTTLMGAINGGAADVGNDLSNDHPISIEYALNDAAGFNPASGTPAFVGVLPLFGGGNDQVECASCHDVHVDTNVPFLRMANTNSQLCTTCHVK